ncbi:MAG TPA: glycosyltransferase, partial [Ferruginibacter sp.]|nr:glycosyltransferase [Ferruginibacter sp.]
DFWIYFITVLNNGAIKVALIGGSPALYISPIFDLGLTESHHLRIDSIINSEKINLALPMPRLDDIGIPDRNTLNIPAKAVILATGGRHSKFQDKDYWKAIGEIMLEEPDSNLLVAGVLKKDIPFFEDIIFQPVAERIIFLGWRKDYLNFFSLSDIIIDTFPQSGGIMILESMALGKPIVTFENNYFKLYDQVDMSMAHEFCGIPELIVPRNNFVVFKKVVLNLIKDEEHRNKVALMCKEKVHRSRGNPQRMVKQIEDIYVDLIEQKFKSQHSGTDRRKQKDPVDLFNTLTFKRLIFYFLRSLRIRFLKKLRDNF